MTMKYETGQSKPIGDVTLDDMLKYPIWIFAIDEEGEEDQDETWQKPITNSSNVGKELFEAYILLNEKAQEYRLADARGRQQGRPMLAVPTRERRPMWVIWIMIHPTKDCRLILQVRL